MGRSSCLINHHYPYPFVDYQSNMMIRFALATLAITLSAASAVENGDKCGVTSSNFMNFEYRSDFMVAGEAGCTLGDDTGCFCAPNLADGESLSEWEWQCNDVVNFGPAAEKVCPDLVPVAKGLGELEIVTERNRARSLQEVDKVASVGTESMQQKMGVACDTAIHPTGRPGDEVCPYSDCDDGGNHSAVCACVDLAKYGMGDGMEWVCMHATCSCGQEDNEEVMKSNEEVESSAATSVASSLVSVSMLALVVLLN